MNGATWTTIFQSPDFVITWYKTFPNYKKIVVCEFELGRPTGMLFLTQDQNGTIVGAGTNIAEYQTWICRPEDSSFPNRAFELLARNFPKNLFHLKYVPDGSFTSAQKRNVGAKHSMLRIKHQRPLMENEVASLEKELKKKNRKEKLNRLNRLGKLEYEKIEDFARFEKVLPILVLQNDLRKGAMYGKTAFIDEPERNDFLLELFKSGLLHASLLKLNDEIIASNVGIMGDRRVYLQGLNTISPYYSKYSPGILHFLILGTHLATEEIPEFDLTPGGTDGYKSMLATKSISCDELFVGTNSKIQWLVARQKIKEWIERKGGSKIVSYTINKLSRFRSLLGNLRMSAFYEFHPSSEGREQKKTPVEIGLDQAMQFIRIDGHIIESGNLACIFRIGKKLGLSKRQEFFQDCLKRMELGQKFHAVHFESQYQGLLWIWAPREVRQMESEKNGILNGEFSFVQHIPKRDRLAIASSIFSIEAYGNDSKCFLYL